MLERKLFYEAHECKRGGFRVNDYRKSIAIERFGNLLTKLLGIFHPCGRNSHCTEKANL